MSDPEKTSPPADSVKELTARNVQSIVSLEGAAQKHRCRSDRVADAISRLCGSMLFLYLHTAWFGIWILLNTGVLHTKPFDPFPFNFLTLVVSLEAIFLSTFILISDNRQARVDERRSHLDLQINLLSEQENTKMLQLLRDIALKVGVNPDKDPTANALEQAMRPEELVAQIDASVSASERRKEQIAEGKTE